MKALGDFYYEIEPILAIIGVAFLFKIFYEIWQEARLNKIKEVESKKLSDKYFK